MNAEIVLVNRRCPQCTRFLYLMTHFSGPFWLCIGCQVIFKKEDFKDENFSRENQFPSDAT